MTRRGLLLLAAVVIAVLVSAGYLASTGARAGGPAVFLALSGVMVCLSVWTVARSALSLVSEPDLADEKVATGRRRKELEREKQTLLKALKELEFDHKMRKISDDDFAEIAAQYRARAVRIMRRLDEGGDYRDQIEREVAARRGVAAPDKAATTPPPGARPPARRACPACATDNEPDADFCKRCAGPLRVTP